MIRIEHNNNYKNKKQSIIVILGEVSPHKKITLFTSNKSILYLF